MKPENRAQPGQPAKATATPAFERVLADPAAGLTAQQAKERADAGAHNAAPRGVTSTVGQIIFKNVFTLFNLINFVLALIILLMGHPRNALFFGVAVCNTLMGIFQELRAKRTLDKLSVLARSHAAVMRDGKPEHIDQQEVVLDDILLLATGNQVCADGVLVSPEGLEVDESLLTGESDRIKKKTGDRVLSGSFVTSGHASVRVTAVGSGSYAGALTVQARKEKKQRTPLMRTLNTIIKVLAIAIFPVGLLLFYTQYTSSGNLETSVLGSSAAVIGMIPEGLILLTGVTLTVGAMKLARRKALVQSLYSIETLARVDVLCLDKTGTITDGTLVFEELVPFGGCEKAAVEATLGEMMAALKDDNATAVALRNRFSPAGGWQANGSVPFSSARKWSAVSFSQAGSYVLGAPDFVLPAAGGSFLATANRYAARGYRVLCLAHTGAPLSEDQLPPGLQPVALVVMSDNIRKEAPDTFRFFEGEGVTLKVISGDNPLTVATIAAKAGIAGAEHSVDMAALPPDTDYRNLVEQYTVFGRVSPEQKKELIAALKANGHTACMTGDGVNDVLAMKEADCSVAMINGSDAARGAADFVLMTSDFSAMTDVLREGRRVINNIENVACLYLVKTIYSTLLSLLYVFIPYPYPFTPLQMTPINALTVGIPSFFLALRGSYEKPQGRFLVNVLENSLPAALTVVFNILTVQLAGYCFGLTQLETSTMNVLLTGAVGFCLLFEVARPLGKAETALLIVLAAAFLAVFFLLGDFFTLGSLLSRNAFFYLPLLYVIPHLFGALGKGVRKAERLLGGRKKAA